MMKLLRKGISQENPHKNGLICYTAGFHTAHVPDIFDLEPDVLPCSLECQNRSSEVVFNVIDLHDKRWYGLQNHHHVQAWKGKYVLSLLHVGIINSHVIYCHFEKKKAIEFYEALAKQLCVRE